MLLKNSGVLKQTMIASCLYIGQMAVGYTLAWTAPVIPKLQDPDQSPIPYPITGTQLSLVGSLLYLGGISGPYLTGYLANSKGRKPCMAIGGMVAFTAYILLATTRSLAMLYIGRFLSGFGIGIITVMGLVYIGEIASTNIRGLFLSGLGVFITMGSNIAFSVGPFVSYAMSAYVGALIVLTYISTIYFLPETPIFHALRDDKEAVKKVLDDLGRTNDVEKVLSTKAQFEALDNIRDWKELFALKGNRRALGIAVTMSACQQASGVLAVTFFATTIFELAASSVEPRMATIIIGSTQLFGSLLSAVFIERAGRRKLMLLSTVMCCFGMLSLGAYFYLDYIKNTFAQQLTWLPLTSLVIFYISYDVGLGIIPNALSGEMFESNVRSKGSAVAVTTSWLIGFLVTTAFGSLITVVGGHVAFWFFAGVCAFAFVFTYFFVPETKGKSLIEIQEMLNK